MTKLLISLIILVKLIERGGKVKIKIEKLRKENGLTQEELAERLSVTQGAVSQWEQGAASPSIDKLPLLAKLLNCSVDELFE